LLKNTLAGELRKEQLSPEQRELEELRTKLKEAEDEKRAVAETQKQQEFQKLQQYYEEDYTSKIIKSLETSGLPKDPSTVSGWPNICLEPMNKVMKWNLRILWL